MTSYGSTFPYGAQECREHLQTLEGFVCKNFYKFPYASMNANLTMAQHRVNIRAIGQRLSVSINISGAP